MTQQTDEITFYQIIGTDDDDLGILMFSTPNYDKAKAKLEFLVEANKHPNLIIKVPVFIRFALLRVSLIEAIDLPNE